MKRTLGAALATGLPLVAWASSSVAQAVHEHGTGVVAGPVEPLEPVLTQARRALRALREPRRDVDEDENTEQQSLSRILRLYQEAASHRTMCRYAEAGA
jgi:hypothetical protein